MKSSIIFYTFLLNLIFVPSIYGQEKIGEYSSSYFSQKYDVLASPTEKKDDFNFFVVCESMDNTSKSAIILINKKEIGKFIDYLTSIKNTYIKWSNTAKENNVLELDKEIECEKINHSCVFSYGDWRFDFYVNFDTRFKIIEGNYYIIIKSGELQDRSNDYITSDGLAIVFSSTKEIDELIEALSITKAELYFKEKGSKEELFK